MFVYAQLGAHVKCGSGDDATPVSCDPAGPLLRTVNGTVNVLPTGAEKLAPFPFGASTVTAGIAGWIVRETETGADETPTALVTTNVHT